MNKPNLPFVTEETIREIATEAKQDNQKLYQDMAVLNPILYQFVYGAYSLPETNKEMMLGMVIATYHALERQIEKEKRNRKRLRHAMKEA